MVVVAVCAAAAAQAFVPSAERVEGAIAETNSAALRNKPLRLELSLSISGGAPVARGELITHPQGLARIELRTAKGLVERHVLQGTEHRASRGGRPLGEPRPFLPPLFLLQAESATTLRAALRSYGVRVDAIGLAPCGARDCFVIGDPRRNVPPWPPVEGPDAEPAAEEADPGVDQIEALTVIDPMGEDGPTVPRTRIWVDNQTYELLRVDFEQGTSVRMGPPAVFEKIRFPKWIQIEDPTRGAARFEITRVAPVSAPAAAFGDAWLFSPTDGDEESAGPASGGPSGAPRPGSSQRSSDF